MPHAVRFGIEEEYVLLDRDALVPVSGGDDRYAMFGEVPNGGRICAEYLSSQFECATTPLTSLQDAGEQLIGMRALLGGFAAERHALLGATGSPFATAGRAQISPSPHYDDVFELLGQLTQEHEVNGMHVHVEVADDEERVRALRRVRSRLPVLLALSANSPFAYGMHSGLESWRSVLIRRLPVSWSPPAFADADDYHRTVQRLVDIGALPVASSASWAVRLSENYDTVEVRVADVQLTVPDALLLAALMRGIVCTSDLTDERQREEELDASIWMAARHGMDARFLTVDGGLETAWDAVGRMLSGIRPALREFGDEDFVDDQLARIRREGTGSRRQAAAHAAGGVDGLRALYAAGAAPHR